MNKNDFLITQHHLDSKLFLRWFLKYSAIFMYALLVSQFIGSFFTLDIDFYFKINNYILGITNLIVFIFCIFLLCLIIFRINNGFTSNMPRLRQLIFLLEPITPLRLFFISLIWGIGNLKFDYLFLFSQSDALTEVSPIRSVFYLYNHSISQNFYIFTVVYLIIAVAILATLKIEKDIVLTDKNNINDKDFILKLRNAINSKNWKGEVLKTIIKPEYHNLVQPTFMDFQLLKPGYNQDYCYETYKICLETKTGIPMKDINIDINYEEYSDLYSNKSQTIKKQIDLQEKFLESKRDERAKFSRELNEKNKKNNLNDFNSKVKNKKNHKGRNKNFYHKKG